MIPARLTSILACSLLVAGCGGGDVNVSADDNSTFTDNSVNNSTSGNANPCARYTTAGGTDVQGVFDGRNCSYNAAFVSVDNPLTVNLTIPFITGVHIFEDTLAVGTNVPGTNPAQVPPAGGQGPTLTIAAGATLAWISADDYLLVNRGSQIIANGSPTAPITLTGFTDAVTHTAGPEDVQLWGGVVINGNGITNKCSDAQRAANGCHVLSEGKPSNYGGNNNADNSGVLRYVVIKHTGFEVAPGDELNGLTLNGVGSGTTISHVQVYSTFDDGVEFFGGAVNVDHLVALFVKDDSIDYADGWVGSVRNALVIHSRTDGGRCIEADNQELNNEALPRTSPVIANMTCVMSGGTGHTHDDSEGVLLRRGVVTDLQNSILFDGYARTVLANNGNECIEIENDPTRREAQNGVSSVSSTLIACQEATKGTLLNTDTVANWVLNTSAVAASYPANVNNRIITASNSGNLVVLRGATAGSRGFFTAAQLVDDAGVNFSVTLTDTDGDGSLADERLGAVTLADNWTSNWTVGLDALWF
jgi:hypothetical protein